MKSRINRIATLVTAVVVLSSCAGADPWVSTGDATVTPSIQIPVSFVPAGPHTASSSGWLINAGFGTAVLSPVTGVVTQVSQGTAANAFSLTVFANGRFSVRITDINTTVRPGDYIASGAQIGTSLGTTLRFEVLLDGTSVCPVTFLNAASKAVVAGSSLAALCTQ